MECTEGQIVLDGSFVKTQEDTIRAGSAFHFSLVKCEERGNTYLPEVEITGQDLNVAFGEKNIALLGQGSWSQAALPTPGKTAFAAVRVVTGQVLVSGFALTENLPPGYVRDRELIYVEEDAGGKESSAALPPGTLIEDYTGRSLTLAGEKYETDVVVYPERVLFGFRFGRGERVLREKLKGVMDFKPATLIVGTGPAGLRMPSEKLIDEIKARGIEVFALPTPKALELYNEMKRQDPKAKVVAVLNIEDYRNADDYLARTEVLCRCCAAYAVSNSCCKSFRDYAGEVPEPIPPTAEPTPPPQGPPGNPPAPVPDVPQSPGEL